MDIRRTSTPLLFADKLKVVPVAEARLQARVTDANEDPVIGSMVADAYDWFAGEAGWLNHRCLLAETFQAYFPAGERPAPGFDHSRPNRRGQQRLELPMRPVLSAAAIAAVEVLQPGGTYLPLDPTTYAVQLEQQGFASIVQTSIFSTWPRFYQPTAGAFRVTFTAGDGIADDVPGPIKRAIKLLAATMYNQRESTAETVAAEVMYGIRALAGRYRLEPDHS